MFSNIRQKINSYIKNHQNIHMKFSRLIIKSSFLKYMCGICYLTAQNIFKLEILFSGEIFDFYDKTLRFKTVVKLENQPREKIREWFKALDRSKVFEGFEMFVCVIIGFGDYYGFYGSDEEFIPFLEIYKHTKDKFGNKPKVIFVDIIHVHVNRGITLILILFRVFFFFTLSQHISEEGVGQT